MNEDVIRLVVSRLVVVVDYLETVILVILSFPSMHPPVDDQGPNVRS